MLPNVCLSEKRQKEIHLKRMQMAYCVPGGSSASSIIRVEAGGSSARSEASSPRSWCLAPYEGIPGSSSGSAAPAPPLTAVDLARPIHLAGRGLDTKTLEAFRAMPPPKGFQEQIDRFKPYRDPHSSGEEDDKSENEKLVTEAPNSPRGLDSEVGSSARSSRSERKTHGEATGTRKSRRGDRQGLRMEKRMKQKDPSYVWVDSHEEYRARSAFQFHEPLNDGTTALVEVVPNDVEALAQHHLSIQDALHERNQATYA